MDSLEVIQQKNPMALIEMAVSQGKDFPIENLERLFDLQERTRILESKEQFFRALSAFQAKCPTIPKEKKAGSGNFGYMYAPLDVIIKYIAPLLQETGLSFTFDTQDDVNFKTTICKIHHIAGHTEESHFRVPIDASARMNDTQKQGSASTYAKRYSLCNALGILTGDEDDDAQSLGTEKKVPEKANSAPVEASPELMFASGVVLDVIKGPTPAKSGKYRYKIVIGTQGYYTFDDDMIKLATEAKKEGNPIYLPYREGKYGKDIVSTPRTPGQES